MVKMATAPEKHLRSEPQSRRAMPGTLLLALASVPFILFLALPLLALLSRATPAEVLSHVVGGPAAQAISLSASTTLITAVLTLIAGTPLAFLVARRRFRGRVVLDVLIDVPMVLPPAVAGIALLLAFGRAGVAGPALSHAGIDIAFTRVAVVMAQLFVASPFYVRTAISAFAQVDRDVEAAAAVDGASPLQVFRHITIPLTAPVLFGGLVMTWARALGEFGATIIFAGNFPGITQTMPLAIYMGFQLNLSIAVALSVVLLVLSFAVLLVVKGVLRQRLQVE